MSRTRGHSWLILLSLHLICSSLVVVRGEEELRACREQEYQDVQGSCRPCRTCDAGHELSKECGFGYGEDARCVACRSGRFKEDRSLQKCKPCLDCALVNRYQKGNCSTTSNALCGDCLPGFYRKTKLSGFQDMECIPCGDPPPPYEPHCSGRVELVAVPSAVASGRDVALAAVICSALATVMLALLVLCVIYCKRQLLEKKPSASLRVQDGPYMGAELSCLERRTHDLPPCHCHLGPTHTCGPVHLIPSLCCDESCSLGRSRDPSPCPSPCPSPTSLLYQGYVNAVEEVSPACLGDFPPEDSSLSRETMGETMRPPAPHDDDDDAGAGCFRPLRQHREPTRGRGEEEEEVSEGEGRGFRSRLEEEEEEQEEETRYEDGGALSEALLPKEPPSALEG